MNSIKFDAAKAKELREKAEEQAQAEALKENEYIKSLSKGDTNKLIHELQVHQIELELQNEELLTIQEELEISRTKYFELYNMAPVGYITLSDSSIITEANLTFCNFIGNHRPDVIKKSITSFILAEDQDIYYKHNLQAMRSNKLVTCDLRMVTMEGKTMDVRLETKRSCDNIRNEYIRQCIVTDVTEIKFQEQLIIEQDRLMHALINNAKNMIFSLDTDYRYTAFNNAHLEEMKKAWGVEINKGDNILDVINNPKYAASLKKTMDKVLKGVRLIENVHQANLNIYYEIDWKPIFDNRLKIIGMTASVRQIEADEAVESR